MRSLLNYSLANFSYAALNISASREGIDLTDDALGGILRVTASTPPQREHFRKRACFAEADDLGEYDTNVQIADLNALNAALAVIKWKKLLGFYRDLEQEYNSTYTTDGNHLTNVDRNS
jgi:hypothetical protein